ncbi:hypothetical protein [Deinococcus sonorensis]|uniref:Lipoprotein n=2 Tax=Deinococcus sonorensis TaxID=309891 RepID=A0AAU7U9J2_9DEIO
MSSRRFLLPLALLGAALAGCAPTQQTKGPALTATTTISQVSFYPSQAGLRWNYLPDGAIASDVPYVLSSQGPTIFAGQEVQGFLLSGRGADQTSYRQLSGDGVLLLGFRKPGLTVTLTPPWREYPAEGAWAVGLSWQGQSDVRVLSDDGKTNVSGKVSYRYSVLDHRTVAVGGRSYTVWVINRQITDNVGGLFPASQELWFAPYVGEVRTPEALLLASRNFTGG